MKKILLIGCGHMGNALLESWINHYSLIIVDPIKFNKLQKKYKNRKIKIFKSILDIGDVTKLDFIVLAIKPLDLENALNQLTHIKIKKQIPIVSVIAGKKISVFKKKFKNSKNIFRVMPNIPALIGEGMNCIVPYKYSNINATSEVVKLMGYSGKTLLLKNENQIDMATAISGSGPGFIFYIIDGLENAAIKLGFNKKIANILVTETFKGTISLLHKSEVTAKEFVKTVATKGGTTEAGLEIFNKNKLHNLFIKTVKKSYQRAKKQGMLNAKR